MVRFAKSQRSHSGNTFLPQIEKTSDQKMISVKRHAYFLPDELKIDGRMDHDFRSRSSIFKLIVYTAQLQITGKFSPLSLSKLNLLPEKSCCRTKPSSWVSDYTGIQEQMKIRWDQQQLEFNAGRNGASHVDKGLYTPLVLQAADLLQTHTFNMQLSLRGSDELVFIR